MEEVEAVESDEIADALQEIRGYTADIRKETDEQKLSLAAFRSSAAAAEADLEKERRAGEHGRDWQVLQERIDLKKTTAADVLNGIDHSPEAEAVRRQAEKGLIHGREIALENIEEDNESGQLEDLKRAQAELARMVAQLGQFRGDL